MSTHQCIHAVPQQPSYYTQAVQSLSQFLFKKGWKITHLIFATIFGEPVQTALNTIKYITDWQTAWKNAGFHDVGTEEGYKQLKEALKTATYAPPVILLHGFNSSTALWSPWIPELKEAQKNKKIGEVIALQLPNDITTEVDLVRKTLARVDEIYKQQFPQQQTLMDLVGHSRGGYVGHITSFKEDQLHDEQNTERRWHVLERNPLVRKVISLAAPTWLCEDGCKDGNDIYPDHGFTEEQKKQLEKSHDHIVDIIATDDAISPTSSPLPGKQVIYVKHTHQGLINCPEVCKKIIELLNT